MANDSVVENDLLVGTALAYFDAGIRVVPVHPPAVNGSSVGHGRAGVTDPGKQPIGKGWQTKEWRRDELADVVRKHRANIGVLCGRVSGFVCIDIDPKNGGLRWFYEHEHELGAHLREETGSGGYHLYYRYPAGHDHLPSFSGVHGLAQGVEWKADGGCQVITAPSLHANGRPYFFHHGLTLLDLAAEADEPPAWLMDIVMARVARKEALAPVGTGNGVMDDPQELARAIETVARIGHRAEGEGRRNTAFRIACLGRDYNISPAVWWLQVQGWNDGNRPPIDGEALRATFRNGYKYAKSPAGSKTVAAQFPDDADEEPDQGSVGLSPDRAEAQTEELTDEPEYYHKNPVTSAGIFLRRHPGILYADETFYRYENDTWHVIDKDALFALVWRDIVAQDAVVCLKSSHVTEIIKAVMARRHRAAVAFDRWDDGRPGDFVRLENGILDLNRVELLPHAPGWFSLTKLPFSYDEHARCPRFEAFLASLWGDGPTEDQIEALQLWFGYLLSAQTSQQRFAMFLGQSRGGKGTLMRLMHRLLGEANCAGMRVDSFRGNFALQELPGKKLISIGDAHSGQHEAISSCAQFVLNVTGEDAIDIDRKNRSIIQVRLGAKIVVGANHMPKFFDSNSSITNRMILFRFVRSFQGVEDLGLDEALYSEMSGILNWAIQGLEKLNARGRLIKPASAQETLAEIAQALNPSDAFVGEFLEPADVDVCVFLDEVYEIYKLWCLNNGHKNYAKSRLSSVIAEHFAGHLPMKRENTPWRAGQKRTFFRGLRLICSLASFRADIETGSFSDVSVPSDDDDMPF